MADMILTLDPYVIKNLKMISDIGNYYQQTRLQHFRDFMKVHSFWPDFENEFNNESNNNEKKEGEDNNNKKKRKGSIDNLFDTSNSLESILRVNIDSVTLLM